MGKFIDLTGQRFGELTVVERAENYKHGGAQWLCKCECGVEKVVRAGSLRGAKVKSCGCLGPHGVPKDIAGKKFGMLIAVERVDSTLDGRSLWRCVCQCGGEKIVLYWSLRSGNTKSCGCLSPGRHRNMEGYVKVLAPNHPNARGNYVLEHVKVMSDHIGRTLKKGETVHHINGVRDDNRLENLELWSSSHPPGQRVKDKVKWAEEILARYKDFDIESSTGNSTRRRVSVRRKRPRSQRYKASNLQQH